MGFSVMFPHLHVVWADQIHTLFITSLHTPFPASSNHNSTFSQLFSASTYERKHVFFYTGSQNMETNC
jgi:hypothetical protein